VCFVTAAHGRGDFLGRRIELRPGRIVDETGRDVGAVDAVELVTVGQRRGLGLPGGGAPRYVTSIDVPGATVRVGAEADLEVESLALEAMVWAAGPVAGPAGAQCSAHGTPRPARVEPLGAGGERATIRFERPERRVAPGQSVVLYDGAEVVGGGIVQVTD